MVWSTPCLILTKQNKNLSQTNVTFSTAVGNHVKEHISRNAKPPETHECSLCHKKVASLNLLQDHVRSEHPDVVVI